MKARQKNGNDIMAYTSYCMHDRSSNIPVSKGEGGSNLFYGKMTAKETAYRNGYCSIDTDRTCCPDLWNMVYCPASSYRASDVHRRDCFYC